MSADEAAPASPISRLPVELLDAILAKVDEPFGLLSPAERDVRLATLVAASRVSRLWHAVVHPLLYRQVELDGGGTGQRRDHGALVKTLWVSSVRLHAFSPLYELYELYPHAEEVKLDGRVTEYLNFLVLCSNLRTLLLEHVQPILNASSSFSHLTTLSFRRVRLDLYHPLGRNLLDTTHFPALRHLALLTCTPHEEHPLNSPSPHIPYLSPDLLAQLDELLLDAVDHELITTAHVPSFDRSTGPRVAWRVDVGSSSPSTTLPFRHDVLPVEHLVVTVRHDEKLDKTKHRRRLLRDVAEVLEGTASARAVAMPAVLWRSAPASASSSRTAWIKDHISQLCERRGIVLETYERARLERAPRVGGDGEARRSGVE
ncbi:uncharacterized protein RHOBADRAFT_55961 [Rhodotorula graminis WP1]|uniref:F-box domain-containing protein n=1 Tax=Rhodotorula graminis (strain WP1) TaxID=578459 RepID=A0A0P9EFH3_RHOGW|nr:uncharacterized protein RHOBADRAFT_55961 [Rhodotorula graminis WP1]KPV72120.1 hypothetical protein RHOBADRAFT_55961 [Rhodotorula graminis WP1]